MQPRPRSLASKEHCETHRQTLPGAGIRARQIRFARRTHVRAQSATPFPPDQWDEMPRALRLRFAAPGSAALRRPPMLALSPGDFRKNRQGASQLPPLHIHASSDPAHRHDLRASPYMRDSAPIERAVRPARQGRIDSNGNDARGRSIRSLLHAPPAPWPRMDAAAVPPR